MLLHISSEELISLQQTGIFKASPQYYYLLFF